MATFAYGIYGLSAGTEPQVIGYASNGLATDSLFEVWDGATNGRNRFRVHKDGDVILGPRTAAAIATNATDGFLVIRTCAGNPTGTASNDASTKLAFLVYDSTNDRLFVRCGTTWRSVAVA